LATAASTWRCCSPHKSRTDSGQLYEVEAGRIVDPYWDVHALLSYGPDWKDFLPLRSTAARG
jgi:hypothetical protein